MFVKTSPFHLQGLVTKWGYWELPLCTQHWPDLGGLSFLGHSHFSRAEVLTRLNSLALSSVPAKSYTLKVCWMKWFTGNCKLFSVSTFSLPPFGVKGLKILSYWAINKLSRFWQRGPRTSVRCDPQAEGGASSRKMSFIMCELSQSVLTYHLLTCCGGWALSFTRWESVYFKHTKREGLNLTL